ncbi:hypothetical protein AC481_07065 [miscellaneous Crenarchaeota group archaeon SMTZ-80]|nr:MAG: hypothetical protein AC481_07065 [miscellaneous Crenarchaeota group archaeon SMTZ-80]
MKNLTLFSSILVLLFLVTQASAQINKSTVMFDKEIHNFGIINIDDGAVFHEFTFINTGNMPFIINEVRTSCGCTTPEWTKEPVIPGQTGLIKVSFNPKGRPGPFSKSITINSNAERQPIVLKITGTVKTGEGDSSIEGIISRLKREYKYELGDIRLKNAHVAFNKILKGQTKTQMIKVANASMDNTVKLGFKNTPEFLTFVFKPEILRPAEEGTIEIIYNSALKNEWDRAIDRLYLTVNGKNPGKNMITVTATIIEDFSGLSPEEKEFAPKTYFESRTYNFGTIKQGKRIEYNFVLKNVGQHDLIIRRIWATCGCTAVTPKKTVIKPDDVTQIKVVFNSAGRKGNQKKMITVVTNDPENPRITLWFEGIVEI